MNANSSTESLKPGFAFQFEDRVDDDHLWFIASDTKEADVVILSLTTVRRWSDLSCLIQAGEHDFVVHESCVAYQYAEIVSVATLKDKWENGDIRSRTPLSDELMLRVWDGAAITRMLPLRCVQILEDQSLI